MNREFFRQLDPPNLLTLGGLVLSLFAAIFAIEGHFYGAILCILYVGLIDVFDGFLARRLSRSAAQRALGGPLDYLSDLCGFGFAPVIFGYCYGLRDWLSVSILALYLLSCASRLAYFGSVGLQEFNGVEYFTGLPVTFAAFFFPSSFLLNFFVTQQLMMTVLTLIYLGMAIAMVAGFRVAKQNPNREGLPKRYTILPICAMLLTLIYAYAMVKL